MPLAITFEPYVDDSGLGYYRRLAAENAMWGWPALAGTSSASVARSALLRNPEFAAAELGLEPSWAQFATRQDQISASCGGGGRRARHDAVCPMCLSEQAYLRQGWESAFATACPRHRVLLVDRCSSCERLLSINRARIEYCECGHDLRTIVSGFSSDAQHWLSSLLVGGGVEAERILPEVVGVQVEAVSDLARTLCSGFDLQSEPRKGRIHLNTLDASVSFLRPLDLLLSDWPANFKAHVSQRIAAGRPGARTLNSLLGAWYAQLKKACLHAPLDQFLKAVLEVAAAEFNGTLTLDNAASVAAETSDYVRASVAASMLGVGSDLLRQACVKGLCASRQKLFGTKGVIYEVSLTEVARISAQRATWVSLDAACEYAGVSPAVMESMMEAKVVDAEERWRKDLFKGGPILLSSVKSLHDRLVSSVTPIRAAEGEVVHWSDLTSRRMGDHKAIRAAMSAAGSGVLLPRVAGRQLGKIGFLASEVKEYFATPLLATGLTIHQLALATGWKWESVSHWIDEGHLGAQTAVLRGQTCQVVSAEQLLAFRQQFIVVADLARSMKTRSSSLVDRLPGVEIVGAKPLPNGARRGGLLRISDLGRLAVAGANSTLFSYQQGSAADACQQP